MSEILRNIAGQAALDRRYRERYGEAIWQTLTQHNALYRHIKTAGASSLDVAPLGSGWDDAMREAAERD